MLNTILAASEAESSGVNPFVIGAVPLGGLLILLAILLLFGKGREHT